jgi:hypothetical protein
MTHVRILLPLWFVLAGCLVPNIANADAPSAASFIPAVRGGPTDIQEPEKVAVKDDVVTAATAQDAINAAVEKNVDDLGGSNIEEIGAVVVRFPSGIGFVATDMATYPVMANPTATRLAKRKAYVIAFVKAKKNLAEILGGLKNEGREDIREELLSLTLPEDEMANSSTVSEEVLKQTVDMMLRGFVVYEVKDDTEQDAVFVSIVTTPKTRKHVTRPAANAVVAGDAMEGLNQVLDEIRSGLVPPVGGRIIGVPSTGQTAFVGFGSAIVGNSTNRALQAKNNYTAKRIAAMRAKDALCGLLIGDQTTWEGSVTEKQRSEVKTFEPIAQEDPLSLDGTKLAEPLEAFRSSRIFQEHASSVRSGILPPGVITKTWFDDEGAWSYSMSVFWAPISVLAEQSAADMAKGPLYDPNAIVSDPASDQVKRPGENVEQGPSGKVSSDRDL